MKTVEFELNNVHHRSISTKIMQKLTTGALMRFAKNSGTGEKPILQVLNVKRMDAKPVNDSSITTNQRYRLILSDGKHFLPSCVLTVQLNDLVTNGQLQEYSIIRLDRYLRSDLNGQTAKMILQVLQVTILDIATHRIGNPISLLTVDLNDDEQTKTKESNVEQFVFQRKYSISETSLKRTTDTIIKEESIKNHRLFKINALNPFQNKWTICVRLAHKTPIRTFSNGDGHFFSCDFVDETGEIRATAFGDDCDRFQSILNVGNIYFVSQAQIKYANKQYNTLTNCFEMTFHNETTIELCSEQISNLPFQHFNFISIDQISKVEVNSFIDVIGMILHIEEIVNGKSKMNKDYTKRDIVIVDQTGRITVTLWFQNAINFHTSAVRKVVLFKGASVNDFNGTRTLSALVNTQIQIDPDLSAAHQLRRWYLEEGMNVDMIDLTIQSNHQENIPLKTFDQINESLSTSTLIRIKAICAQTRHDPVYKACSRSDCKKKLQDNNDGTFYCSKCQMNYEKFRLLYMANILLADSTGSQWVSFFEKQCELLFACSPEEFPHGKSKIDEEKAFEKLISIIGIEKIFVIRIKSNRYQNQDRLQLTCVGIEPIDGQSLGHFYLEEIGRMCRSSSK